MSNRRGFKTNQKAIDKHVKEIAEGYKKAGRRYGPTVPIHTTYEPPAVPTPRFPPTQETSMPESRSARVRRAFFRWFVEHESETPGWLPFLTEVRSVDNADVTETELYNAMQLLIHDGLLDGPRSRQEMNLKLLVLTVEGQRCVDEHDSDPASWARRRHPAGGDTTYYTDLRDQRTYASGNTGPVVVNSPDAQVHQHVQQADPDTRAVLRAVRFLLSNLDDLAEEGFDAPTRQGLAEQGAAVVTELENTAADAGRVRALAERLNSTLLMHPMAAGVAGGMASGSVSATVTAMLSAALKLPPS